MILRIEMTLGDGTWQAKITSPDHASWVPVERDGTLDANGYPLPPAAEQASWILPSLPLCSDPDPTVRKDANDRFLLVEPRTGDVEMLGGYLFSVLLGDTWAAIKPEAATAPLRLQLALPAQSLWHSLPWELMVNRDGPLVTSGKTVGVTRLIKADGNPDEALSIEIPIRVLFVIGRALDNQLRPGAEYLSIMRQLQCTLGGEEEAKGTALHTRLLLEATSEDITKAMEEFKPAVVHLICHGQQNGTESEIVLTRYEGTSRSNPKPDPVNAKRLSELLRVHDKTARPLAVVLNACNTARVDVQASFAGELVRRSIPMVVGMAGEVADSACRLFARQFYTALVEQQPADIAAAEGRAAALLHFNNWNSNFDWARAVFYQADGVTLQFKLLPVQRLLLTVAEQLRPKKMREPFCGRLSWLPVFRELFTSRIKNLGVVSAEEARIASPEEARADGGESTQLGKTRLLEELAWQAVLEGWIPMRVIELTRYANLLQCAVDLFTIMEQTRDLFQVPRAYSSEVVREACQYKGIVYPPGGSFMTARDAVYASLDTQQSVVPSPDTIRELLQDDLEALRKAVEAKMGPRKGVLILWDQLDRQEGLEEQIVKLFRPYGLGCEACPAPVVFTYAAHSAGGKRLVSAINSNPEVVLRELVRYDTFENGMACRQFLAWKKLVPPRPLRPWLEKTMPLLEKKVDGYPSRLHGANCQRAIEVLTTQGVLVEFDDVKIMNRLR